MDIIERMFTFIDYSETQAKSMIASGIILIESINQTRASWVESEKEFIDNDSLRLRDFISDKGEINARQSD